MSPTSQNRSETALAVTAEPAEDGAYSTAEPATGVIIERPTSFWHSRTFIFLEMLIFAALSLLAAWMLSIEALHLAADPKATLSCDLNTIISCGKVGTSWQAKVFGFPNAFFGMVAEPVVITIAVAALAKTKFPRWFLFTANVVYFLAVIFAYWLLSQSVFVIHALCPWCLLVTLSTTLVFTSMLQWNILENNLYLKPSAQAKAMTFVRSGALHIATAAWILAVIAFLWLRYGSALIG